MPRKPASFPQPAPVTETIRYGTHKATGLPRDRVAWTVRRWEVTDRAKGQCEVCRSRRGVHVRHLRFAPVVGHEEPAWLQLVCLDCQWELNEQHGRPQPTERFRRAAVEAARQAMNAALLADPRGQSPRQRPGQRPGQSRKPAGTRQTERAAADARTREVCAHCGGTWTKAKHRAICVKHGLDRVAQEGAQTKH
jgi:hypothetical protein